MEIDREMPEAYLPELKEVLANLPQTSRLLDQEVQRIKEAAGEAKVASSASGVKFSLNLQGQSIHEDVPTKTFTNGIVSWDLPIFGNPFTIGVR